MVQLVGILNLTPDSFSDGGQFTTSGAALAQAEQLFSAGAVLVDVGAESTRPNASAVPLDEEWARLSPVLSTLLTQYPGAISLDSYHPETVARAAALGDIIVNDVTGLSNPDMLELVVKLQARVIISHLPGSDIQAAHHGQPVETVDQVKMDLLATAKTLQSRGLAADKIILDPGIGFGKTVKLNWQLLEFAQEVPDYQIMIGYSRKRFLGDNRMELAPNLAAGRIAIASGAAYLRVHDVTGHASLLTQVTRH